MNLNNTLIDIALTPVRSGAYGDFEIKAYGTRSVFTPISQSAIEWVHEHIPDWVDRYEERGFILDTDEMAKVVAAANRDRLMSCEEFQESMNELNQLARSWEE